MKKEDIMNTNKKFLQLDDLNIEEVWYACYGSNINYNRLMLYINKCNDKSKPLEEKPFIINHPIYFACESNLWTGGMAFLDYQKEGKSYGKIYKIKISQFKDIYKQEPNYYDTIILLDYINNLPVLTFTSKNKLDAYLNNPSIKYKKVIMDGLKDLKYNLTEEEMNKYLSNE